MHSAGRRGRLGGAIGLGSCSETDACYFLCPQTLITANARASTQRHRRHINHRLLQRQMNTWEAPQILRLPSIKPWRLSLKPCTAAGHGVLHHHPRCPSAPGGRRRTGVVFFSSESRRGQLPAGCSRSESASSCRGKLGQGLDRRSLLDAGECTRYGNTDIT